MMAVDYFVVQVVATGLQPKEELRIDQQSGSEQAQTKAMAEADGTYRVIILPFVKGQASGKLRFKVDAKSCVVGVEVPWGKGGYVIQ